jgi:nucleoside-diphosphate-sugar epimerase
MKVSIIGSNGFLATAIGQYANSKNWTLSVLGLEPPKSHDYDEFYEVNLVEQQIDSSTLMDSDIVIYAAGAGIQATLNESSKLIYHLNTFLPIQLCDELRQRNYQGIFVTFGSVFEMGATTSERKFLEEDILVSRAPSPSDYVVSKRMLSRFVTSFNHHFTYWHFIIPTIYGKGENPNRLIPYTIDAIRNRVRLAFTSGEQVRQYVHVSEIPTLIDLAYTKKLPSGIYNIEGSETKSVKEIVEEIHRLLGVEIPADCFGTLHRTDTSMKYLALDGSKLYNAIGFKSSVRISDVINNY